MYIQKSNELSVIQFGHEIKFHCAKVFYLSCLVSLTAFPSSLGALRCLKQLHIASNKLMCLPAEIGFLTDLEVLKAQNNR